jgi:putative modified peptide
MANTLASNVVATLLDKLGSDDAFRELFQKNPAAALQQAGASKADAESCAHCMKPGKLASKDAIKASKQALTAQLTGALNLTPVHLNAS